VDRTELTGILHAERERLGRTIQYVDPATWGSNGPCLGWSNRDLMAHLAAQDAAAAQAIAGEPAAELDAFREANGGDLWVDGFNEWAVGVRAELPARQIAIDWGRAADLFCSRAADLPPDEWNARRVPWLAGDIGEDGWFYFFNYEYKKNKDESLNKSYVFNGYNLKYKHIDGYDIPITDSKTNKVIGTAQSSLPYLLLNQELKPDIETIVDFFTKNQFVHPIEASDLDGLKIKKLNKEDILKLFNQAMEKEELASGKYSYLPEADVVQETPLSGYQWQVGFFIGRGNVLVVRIDLIYKGNTYLSDLVSNNKADESQKNIYNKVKEIENKVISEQSFNITDFQDLTIDTVQFKRLYTLLQKIESGGNKN
jgi:hypothetical protein